MYISFYILQQQPLFPPFPSQNYGIPWHCEASLNATSDDLQCNHATVTISGFENLLQVILKGKGDTAVQNSKKDNFHLH